MSDTAFSVPTSLPKASGDWPTYGNKSNDDASSALGVDEKKMAEVTRTLSDIKSREIDADERVAGQLGNLTSKALPKIEELSKTAGLEAEKMKPWNEEAEAKKRSTDPIANFASLGSVFGILASAFTHAPMENALNASAAAMNAIKAGNAEDYNRAYKAWESNTKQALDRYKIEHGAFEDAVSLLKTNMEAGQTMMRVNAIRFGNEKEKALIEQGMTKELFEYRQAMQKMALELDKDAIPRAERHAEMAVLLNNGYKPTEPNNPANGKAMEALNAYNADRDRLKKDPSVTTEMGANIRAFRTTPKEDGTLPTPDEVKDFIKDQRTTKQLTIEQETMDRWDEENPNATAAERKDFAATLPGAKGKGSSRQQKPDEEAVRSRIAELRKEFPEMSLSAATQQAEREQKKNSQVITANKADELQGKIDRVKFAKEKLITPIENLLMKHNLIAGLGGSATRPFEIMANILGSNATDRKEFQRLVSEMQMIAPRILLDTSGRPLGAEANRINTEIAGLAPGDTGPNSIRAYFELRDQMDFIENNLAKRKDSGAGSEAPKASGDKWWESPAAGRVK